MRRPTVEETSRANLLTQHSIRCQSVQLFARTDATAKGWFKSDPDATHWQVMLYRSKGASELDSMIVEYSMNSAHRYLPKIQDVLGSLFIDAWSGEISFADFCGGFGYDPDSRKVKKMWSQCKKHAKDLRKFLGEQYEELEQAFQNY